MYKNHFTKKFYITGESGEEIIYSEKPQKKSESNNIHSSRDSKIDGFIAGLGLGCLLYFGSFKLIIAVTLLVIAVTHTVYSKKRKAKTSLHDMIRRELIVGVPLDEIFSILQNLRM